MVNIGDDGSFLVCKVEQLLPVVWASGSEEMGDVRVQKVGGNKGKEGPYEPLYTQAGKKQKGGSAAAVSYTLVGKKVAPHVYYHLEREHRCVG